MFVILWDKREFGVCGLFMGAYTTEEGAYTQAERLAGEHDGKFTVFRFDENYEGPADAFELDLYKTFPGIDKR